MEEIYLSKKNISKKTIQKSIKDDDISQATFKKSYYLSKQSDNFNQILKIKVKEKQFQEIKKKKNNFIQKFYKKLKEQLQNCKQPEQMKDNMKMLDICMKKRHMRNITTRNTARTTLRTSHTSRLSDNINNKQNNISFKIQKNDDKLNTFYQQRATKIINTCNKQRLSSHQVYKKINLLKFYNFKITQKLKKTDRKLKKTIMQF